MNGHMSTVSLTFNRHLLTCLTNDSVPRGILVVPILAAFWVFSCRFCLRSNIKEKAIYVRIPCTLVLNYSLSVIIQFQLHSVTAWTHLFSASYGLNSNSDGYSPFWLATSKIKWEHWCQNLLDVGLETPTP